MATISHSTVDPGVFLDHGSRQDWNFIVRLNPALDEIVPADAKVEKLAENFGFSRGLSGSARVATCFLAIFPRMSFTSGAPTPEKASIFLPYSGFTGADDTNVGMQLNKGRGMVTLLGLECRNTGSAGRIVYCAHGDHQVVRVETDGRRTVLASEFEGKRLNSPNDLVYKSDGSLYFTDPIAGFRDR